MATLIGMFIESIPGVGRISRKYADFLSTPSRKVDEHLNNIKLIADNLKIAEAQAQTDIKMGLETLDRADDLINQHEQKIQQLTMLSPILQANPEERDRIMEEILIIKKAINLFIRVIIN